LNTFIASMMQTPCRADPLAHLDEWLGLGVRPAVVRAHHRRLDRDDVRAIVCFHRLEAYATSGDYMANRQAA
jgi:hypothetical protein